MIEDVARSLAAALPECSAEELADVLWLVAALHVQRDAPSAMPDEQLPEPAQVFEPPPMPHGTTEPTPHVGRSELILAQGWGSHAGGRMVQATAVGLRSPASLGRPLSTARALSPFKRIHGPGPQTVDVEATVEATADARRLVVVTSPGRERGLDVALVVDSSPVMTACHNSLAEFEASLRRVGAFRSVSRWELVQSPPPHFTPGNRAEGSGPGVLLRDISGIEHHPDRLLDPSGRRLVLLATDAVADHWYRAALWRVLARWAQVMPTDDASKR